MRLRPVVFCALVLLAACDRVAAAPTGGRPVAARPTPANQAASDFVIGAIGEDMYEVRAAASAAARAKSPAVKAFAALMAKDHAASMAALNRAIAASGENLQPPSTMSDHLQSMLNQLGRGADRDYDKTYIEQQVEAHEEALAPMTAYAGNGAVPAIRAVAQKLAPTVQAHLDQARTIQDALNKGP